MKKLRKTREMSGLTQFELAKAAGLTANKITFWETGRSQLTDAELERVKNALAARAKEVQDALAAA
jgi:transcriptional regulator with XRE-family HTH domain